MAARFLIVALALSWAAAGCRFGQMPNPHKEDQSAAYDGEALQKSVRQADEALTERLIKGQIDADTKRELFHDYIREQLEDVKVSEIPDEQAWRFADVYRQLEDWQTTESLYKRAVEIAPDEDRRVNDTLRLAEAKARLGDVPTGIELARSTFDAQPGGKAPILMAILYEFTPAALYQGHDIEVAQLLEDAMGQHLSTVVDPATDAGRLFIEARAYHIQRAWETALRIYRRAGDEQMFRDAIERADAMQRRFAQA